MPWAICTSCGHEKDCDEQEIETVDENGDLTYETDHVCPECLEESSD